MQRASGARRPKVMPFAVLRSRRALRLLSLATHTQQSPRLLAALARAARARGGTRLRSILPGRSDDVAIQRRQRYQRRQQQPERPGARRIGDATCRRQEKRDQQAQRQPLPERTGEHGRHRWRGRDSSNETRHDGSPEAARRDGGRAATLQPRFLTDRDGARRRRRSGLRPSLPVFWPRLARQQSWPQDYSASSAKAFSAARRPSSIISRARQYS